jgi:hypothetical protein
LSVFVVVVFSWWFVGPYVGGIFGNFSMVSCFKCLFVCVVVAPSQYGVRHWCLLTPVKPYFRVWLIINYEPQYGIELTLIKAEAPSFTNR